MRYTCEITIDLPRDTGAVTAVVPDGGAFGNFAERMSLQKRERVRLDLDYVNRASVWFDLWIVAMTLPCLLGDRERSR